MFEYVRKIRMGTSIGGPKPFWLPTCVHVYSLRINSLSTFYGYSYTYIILQIINIIADCIYLATNIQCMNVIS